MAKVSDAYLDVLDKYLYHGLTSLEHVAMTPEQKLRTQIVYEAYQVWLSNKQVRPMELCKRIANRVYDQLLVQARRDPKTQAFVERCKIMEGKSRSTVELYNDVAAFNHIVGQFTAPVQHIEKAKVLDASDWLIEHGMQMGDGRDVAKGADLKMRMNKDFDEQQQGFEELANADMNITGDVSVVKSDRTNYTPEQRREYAKRFGLSEKEVIYLVQNAEGTFVPEEDAHDPFAEEGK